MYVSPGILVFKRNITTVTSFFSFSYFSQSNTAHFPGSAFIEWPEGYIYKSICVQLVYLASSWKDQGTPQRFFCARGTPIADYLSRDSSGGSAISEYWRKCIFSSGLTPMTPLNRFKTLNDFPREFVSHLQFMLFLCMYTSPYVLQQEKELVTFRYNLLKNVCYRDAAVILSFYFFWWLL